MLKKEIAKTSAEEGDKNADYRAMLITAIHKSATRFPDAISTLVPILVGFLGDSNQSSAVDVIIFIREIVETYTHLREAVVEQLRHALPTIQSSRVARVALWLLGEYSVDASEVAKAMTTVKACLGELPFTAPAEGVSGSAAGEAESSRNAAETTSSRPLVLPDGTYAAQSAMEENTAAGAVASAGDNTSVVYAGGGGPKLRSLLVAGDFFLATVVATTLTKLALRTRLHGSSMVANLVAADTMLVLSGLLRLGAPHSIPSPLGGQLHKMDLDSQERISMYLQVRTHGLGDAMNL